MCLLETFASDRRDLAAATQNSQVPVWLLSFSGSEEPRCIFHLLLERLQRGKVLPAQRALHRLFLARQPLMLCPHFHAGDVDVIAATEPGRNVKKRPARVSVINKIQEMKIFPHGFCSVQRIGSNFITSYNLCWWFPQNMLNRCYSGVDFSVLCEYGVMFWPAVQQKLTRASYNILKHA